VTGRHLEVERVADSSRRFDGAEIRCGADERQRLCSKSERVVAIPVLSTLGLAEDRDEVGAGCRCTVEPFAEVRYRQCPRGWLGKQ
jgi:hypothetical protein